MALLHFLSLFFVLAFIDLGLTLEDIWNDDDNNEVERIVNGMDAKPGMFPWTAALFYKDRFVCSASIISKKSIMSAAHCVVFNGVLESPEDYYAIIGSVDKTAPETRVEFSKITPHPDYESVNNDLAILTTMDEIQFNDKIQAICLADSKIGCLTLKPVIAMGWGITTRDTNVTATPDILQYTKLRVYSNAKCSTLYFGKVPKTIMCAGAVRTGICSGDSGGPLVLKSGKKYVQVGVASFVNTIFGCARLLGPAGFTRVSSYNDFIKSTAEGDVCFTQ